jgi:hypothetical protein
MAQQDNNGRQAMKTPRDKYMNDPDYNHLVLTLEGLIEQARFTPSELREAVILACINYEMRHVRENQINPRVFEALEVLDQFTNRSSRNRS